MPPLVLSLLLVVVWLGHKTATDVKESLPFSAIEVGSFPVTSYRSVPAQTKPRGGTWTSIGIRTNPWLVAVSQDLLRDRKVRYNDLLWIEGVGFKLVGDCMHKRHTNRLDVWVATYAEEQQFDKKFRGKTVRVWKIFKKEKDDENN